MPPAEPIRPTPEDIGQTGPLPTPDDRARAEQRVYTLPELRRLRYEQETRRRALELKLRLGTAVAVYLLVIGWLIAVILILVWQGWPNKTAENRLSDSVLITLLATTSINIIGLLAAVVRYLFPAKSPSGIVTDRPSRNRQWRKRISR